MSLSVQLAIDLQGIFKGQTGVQLHPVLHCLFACMLVPGMRWLRNGLHDARFIVGDKYCCSDVLMKAHIP